MPTEPSTNAAILKRHNTKLRIIQHNKHNSQQTERKKHQQWGRVKLVLGVKLPSL